MGTPEIAKHCLQAMIKDPHFEVVGVVTQPDRPAGRKMRNQPSPVKELVLPLGIPVLSPESVNTPEVLKEIDALRAEVVVVVAFGQILKQEFLDRFYNRVVNVHASLLPRWRGAAPIQRALMNGDTETGVCLQLMARKLDAGPVVGWRKIPLTPDTTAHELYRACAEFGANLIEVDLMDYLRGNLAAIPQDESLVTYAPKITKEEAELKWEASARDLHNRVRGLTMGPVAYTAVQGKIVKVHKTAVKEELSEPSATLRAGQVKEVTEKSLIVQCGKGSLELLEVQPESRAKMPMGDYLRGYPVQTGDSFDTSSSASSPT